MFFKYATLLAFTASAIAGAIVPGIYRITNVASQSPALSFQAYDPPVSVSSTKGNAGEFELVSSCLCLGIICLKLQWDVRDSGDGSYTLHNVGLGTTGAAFYYYVGP